MKPYYDDGTVTIYHGAMEDVLAATEPAFEADIVFTDPPYGNGNGDNDFQDRKSFTVDGPLSSNAAPEKIANDAPANFNNNLSRWLSYIDAHARDDSAIFVMCSGGGGPEPKFVRVAAMMDSLWNFRQALVWDKRARGPGLGMRFRRDYEFVMLATPERLPWVTKAGDGAMSNVIDAAPPANRKHPNEKPVELVAACLRPFAAPGRIVLDPFCGSGTTLAVARELGMRAIGIDVDEKWCKLSAERVAQRLMF